ncbi:MAG: universal stress protein [Deltaproteobacteria bacterium]|nr:universal stress protein [Deltaproteobacteria bacterium]
MIPKIENVLYATDLTKNSAYAFRYAVNTARQHDAKIHILYVSESLPFKTEELLRPHIGHDNVDRIREESKENLRRRIEERLQQFAERELKDDPKTLKRIAGIHVVFGDPAAEILNKTDELGCDTVIMGSHGKGAVKHTFLGSVSEKVLHRIRKPVYIIPLPKEDTDITLGEI